SSIGADSPDQGPSKLQTYLKAKSEADEKLKKSNLNYTIIRPGRLSNDEMTGKILVDKRLENKEGEISRADVASTIVASLLNENTYRKTFEVLAGDQPINVALATLDIRN